LGFAKLFVGKKKQAFAPLSSKQKMSKEPKSSLRKQTWVEIFVFLPAINL
jgi:hypothetical protein